MQNAAGWAPSTMREHAGHVAKMCRQVAGLWERNEALPLGCEKVALRSGKRQGSKGQHACASCESFYSSSF